MARLGYTRYGAQGGDWGSIISTQVAARDAAHVAGLHLNMCFGGAPAGNRESPAYRSSSVSAVAMRASKSFGIELERLRADFDPAWERRTSSGRINAQRYMTGADLDEVFDRWDEGRDDAVDIEAVILLDVSGSMHSDATNAYESMWALKRALDKVGAGTTVVTFASAILAVVIVASASFAVLTLRSAILALFTAPARMVFVVTAPSLIMDDVTDALATVSATRERMEKAALTICCRGEISESTVDEFPSSTVRPRYNDDVVAVLMMSLSVLYG
jgi:pimeloyl-ACP methyl ester carboxylesterase